MRRGMSVSTECRERDALDARRAQQRIARSFLSTQTFA
jgi:hypothetical protein